MTTARWLLLIATLAVVSLLGVALGTIPVSPAELLAALRGDGDPVIGMVVTGLRMPRVALAILVGLGLGMSGAALQGSLRNPLAEPYLLGVSGGAAVGAVLAVTLGLAFGAIPLAAFAGAVVAVLLALFVARVSGLRSDPRILVMAGVVVGAFANAGIMVLLAGAPASTVRGALWWMMGSVGDATPTAVLVIGLYCIVPVGVLVAWARDIDALALGDDAAAGLGIEVDRAMRRVFIAAAALAAVTVAAAGLIGFVGLVVPHLARALGARRHRPLLIASGILGAALVVGADVVARIARPPAELPLGAVTALLGVPFFLARLRKLA